MTYTGKVTSAESLGRILQQARLLSGLSQRELARRLGTTQKYVWELEAGKPSILMDRLFAAGGRRLAVHPHPQARISALPHLDLRRGVRGMHGSPTSRALQGSATMTSHNDIILCRG